MSDQPLTIVCPHCRNSVSLDEALTHELTAKVRQDFETRLATEKAKWHKEALVKAEQAVKERFELEMKTAREELAETKKRNQELLTQLTETNRLIRDLKRRDEERALEVEKQKLVWEEKIRSETKKAAEEENRLKLLEKDKQLQNALKETEELKRKLTQGSQQNQGEVLELELEKILTHEFPNDQISPVGKGIRGADLIHEVWDRNGTNCGKILWETKNAKWNEEWVVKLKYDQRQINAETAVIVSEILPSSVKSAAYYKGVWITHRTFVQGLAMALRASLIQLKMLKSTIKGNESKKDILWNYLTSSEFKHRMDAIFESYQTMRLDLEKEKQTSDKNFAKRTKQLDLMSQNTAKLLGNLEGVLGHELPEIKQLELTENSEQYEEGTP